MRIRPHGSLEWDDGRASERTVLAWERTAVASLAVAALTMRAAVVHDLVALAAPGTALLVLAAVAEWRQSQKIYREHDLPLERGAVTHEGMLAAVTGVTVAAAIAAAALTLVG